MATRKIVKNYRVWMYGSYKSAAETDERVARGIKKRTNNAKNS